MTEYLLELSNRKFGLAISTVTAYEILKGVDISKEQEVLKVIEVFLNYEVDRGVLVAAARLDSIYSLENIHTKEVDDCDKFIAATALLTGSVILTTNARDFPWPIFREVERKYIEFDVNKKWKKSVAISLLEPDWNIVKMRLEDRSKGIKTYNTKSS